MTKREIPRDADGFRLCEFCMETRVPESLGTKPKRYCSRNCRQRAYEVRQRGELLREAVARGVEMGRRLPPSGTSRDVPPSTPAMSRDVVKRAAPPAVQPADERFETWRRTELSRPPLKPPAEDASPEELAAWRAELARPLMLPFDDEADGAQP